MMYWPGVRHRHPLAEIAGARVLGAFAMAAAGAALVNEPARAQAPTEVANRVTAEQPARPEQNHAAIDSVPRRATVKRPRPLAMLIAGAVRDYDKVGVATTITAGSVTAYPFGHSEPVLACAVLRACVLELEPGERLVNAPLAGDQARWIVNAARAGSDGADGIIVVKPKQCGIRTNLVVSTDRRVYDVDLTAARCARASLAGSTDLPVAARHIRFFYPDAVRTPGDDAARGELGASQLPNSGERPALTLASERNTSYRIVRKRRLFGRERVRFPWRPRSISDDGAHVYIELPADAARNPAPVLYAIEDDGSRTLVNYTITRAGDAPAYVTDRTFRRGALVLTLGKTEQRLVFENRAWRAPEPVVEAQPERRLP